MADIVNISYTGTGNSAQSYTQADDALITNNFIYTQFGDPNDYVEMFISDDNNNILDSVYDVSSYKPGSNLNSVTGLHNEMILDPQGDLASRGYDRGSLNVQYNFYRNLFNSSYLSPYWIKEISTSRKEIKLTSNSLSNTDILNGFNQYQAYIAGLNYFNDFYLNFGNNNAIIAVNVAYTEDDTGSYLLIKLYEPLPSDYDLKSTLWIVEKLAESAIYNVNIQVEAIQTSEQNPLRGPNFNVAINQKQGQTTPYYSYTSLLSTPVSSSFQKMLSYYQDKSVNINVDYTNFSNFIHFSSAVDRVQNFVTKVGTIENYNNQINQQLSLQGGLNSTAISSSVVNLRNSVNNIITNFDNYEYYLYYSSESFAWPKSNSTQPYNLCSVTSSQAKNWLGSNLTLPSSTGSSILFSASYYDATNKDMLVYTIPQYILDDESNQPYVTFVNMIGQHFDNIWLYYKDVTNRFEATNNPKTGISPDLVADALMNLGFTLYTNTNISDNLYYSMFGINQDGSLLPPTGSEHISNYVTSSIPTISANSIQDELYKRLYHNIPYLYKTKGTRDAFNALTNIFGVTGSILTLKEFGGVKSTDIDGIYDLPVNVKVSGSSVTLEISSSLLDPYVSLQYYDNSARLNSKDIEFGFSPSDEINLTISSSLGAFNMDQYIGDPNYQYSGSYPALDKLETSFFSGYNYKHNILEYIRFIKYYNNSLFKIAQDFVPARTNLSKGFIVKSHMLERNKYQRHEPVMDMSQNFSQSLETVTIYGSDAPVLKYTTNYSSSIPSVSGSINVNNSYSWEKYTGEFGGTEIVASTNYFDQYETSSITAPWTSSVSGAQHMFVGYNLGATYQNVSSAIKSKFAVKADYSYNQNVPVNAALISSSLECSNCPRYRGSCVSTILTNIGTVALPYSYVDCYGTIVTGTVPLSGSVGPACIKYNTFTYGRDTGMTGSLNNIGVCGNYASYDEQDYCFSYSWTATGSYQYSYYDCNNIYISQTGVSNGGKPVSVCAIPNSVFAVNHLESAPVTPVLTSGSCGSSSIQYMVRCYDSYIMGNDTTAGSFGQTFDLYYTDCQGNYNLLNVPKQSCFDTVNVTNLTGSTLNFYYTDCNGDYLTSTLSAYTETQIFGVISGSVGSYDDHPSYSVNYLNPIGNEFCYRTGSIFVPQQYSNPYTLYNTKPCGTGYLIPSQSIVPSSSYYDLQDYNYYRQSSVNSRYNGAQNTSADYNTYSSSLGNVPNIDYHVYQLGLFTQIQSSSYMPNEMLVKMVNLADVSGGLVELNLQNRNWVDVQNIFKKDSYITVKQFNASKFSNNTYLDKQRQVIESGYTYRPYYYRETGSVQLSECFSSDLSYNAGVNGPTFSEITSLTSGVVKFSASAVPNGDLINNYRTISSGSGTYPYFVSLYSEPMAVTDFGNNLTNYYHYTGLITNNVFSSGSYYTASIAGFYRVNANINFISDNPQALAGYNSSFKLMLLTGSAVINSGTGFPQGSVVTSSIVTVNTNDKAVTNLSMQNVIFYANQGDQIAFSLVTNYNNPYSQGGSSTSYTCNTITINNLSNSSNLLVAYVDCTTGNIIALPAIGPLDSSNPVCARNSLYYPISPNAHYSVTIGSSCGSGSTNTHAGYHGINIQSGWILNFDVLPVGGTTCRNIYGPDYVPQNYVFQSSSFNSNQISLTSTTNEYFNQYVTYLPGYSDGSNATSSLYSRFGDIDYSMLPEVGDYMIFYYNGQIFGYAPVELDPQKFQITKVDIDPVYNTYRFTVSPSFPSYYNSSTINRFESLIFLKKVPDETAMILKGKKGPFAGNTSYGFIVPELIDPNVMQNLNTLQSTVQSQLLDAGTTQNP